MVDEQAAFIRSVARNSDVSEAERTAIFALLEFTEAQPCPVPGQARVSWGKGQGGSFHYSVWLGLKRKTLFTCDARGHVSLSVGNFINEFLRRPSDKQVRSIVGRLAAIPGFKNLGVYSARPGFSISETLVREQVMARFQEDVLRLQRVIEG